METDAGGGPLRDLFVFNGGFLQPRLRQMLALAGWRVRIGRPSPTDWIGVWGGAQTAWRAERVARATGAKLLRVEDAFARSLFPGRAGEAPLGLILDQTGVYFDGEAPNDLETCLATSPLNAPALLARADAAIKRMRANHLSKFSAVDPTLSGPEPGYVLVVDQVRGDAAAPDPHAFQAMLASAREGFPGARIVIKSHPETVRGLRPGHFSETDLRPGECLIDAPVSGWRLFEDATAVCTVSSLMGFEAILAGHRPIVFGKPFYAGWDLSEDAERFPRRARNLTAEQLFAGAMIETPVWFDPYRRCVSTLEDALASLEAQTRVWRRDRAGYTAIGLRRWKRPHMRAFFGRHTPLGFAQTVDDADRRPLVWGDAKGPPDALRVEDGYLRSRGLGARLVPPVSLACDTTGLACDPRYPSDLEKLIAASRDLPSTAIDRARVLIETLRQSGLSKYGPTDTPLPPLPKGRRILVTGQVADDASVRLGCIGSAKSDTDLLFAVREHNPDAIVIFKPHPDVLAGLRDGLSTTPIADYVLGASDPVAAIEAADEVWTLTSTLGFEALLRGVPVTCLGMPFYAGWGLTRDHAPVPSRRGVTVSLEGLVHAALIQYPRYLDPVTGLPCPVEVAVERLYAGHTTPRRDPLRRALYELQKLRAFAKGR